MTQIKSITLERRRQWSIGTGWKPPSVILSKGRIIETMGILWVLILAEIYTIHYNIIRTNPILDVQSRPAQVRPVMCVACITYTYLCRSYSYSHFTIVKYFIFYSFPFPSISGSTSVWLTLSFTIERYIAVCHPMRGKVRFLY